MHVTIEVMPGFTQHQWNTNSPEARVWMVFQPKWPLFVPKLALAVRVHACHASVLRFVQKDEVELVTLVHPQPRELEMLRDASHVEVTMNPRQVVRDWWVAWCSLHGPIHIPQVRVNLLYIQQHTYTFITGELNVPVLTWKMHIPVSCHAMSCQCTKVIDCQTCTQMPINKCRIKLLDAKASTGTNCHDATACFTT